MCFICCSHLFRFFFFNDTATTEIYTLSLHDALPISLPAAPADRAVRGRGIASTGRVAVLLPRARSEEHTSELQSRLHLVCRLLLEKKKIGSCRNGDYQISKLSEDGVGIVY